MSVFVGRSTELEQLKQRLDRAVRGEGGAVFITGDAGAGKSTLTERFLVEAALEVPDARVISSGCSEQYGAGEPYQPFVDAFRDLATAEEGGKKRFRDLAKQLAPYWVAAIPIAGEVIAATVATATELKETLGGGGTATAAPPNEEALFFQYTELLLAVAEEHPVLLFIDDLHWADRASVTLLAHIARRVADKRVFILGTYRAADVEVSGHPIKEAKLELERYGVAEEMALSALDSDALADLVREELGADPAPELLRLLEKRAGNNPLFFSELLRWLVEQGLVREAHGEWSLTDRPDEIEIPRSAESVIEKRLGRLELEVHKIVEYASVQGDEFDSVVLSQLLEMDELDLEEALDPLARTHRLVRLIETRDLPNGDIASVYQFSHSLIQDVLHNNLQGKRRILLHRKVAQILEGIHGAETGSIAYKLAYHYDQGRVQDRAHEFGVRAAERASRVYAHWDAIDMLELALRNSQENGQRVDVLERLGEENRLIGRYADALGQFREALDAVSDDPLTGLRLRRRITVVERDYGNRSPQELLAQLDDLASKARDLDAREELCEILWRFSVLPGAPSESASEALEIAETIGDPALVARARYQLATVLMFSPDPAEAIPHLNEALSYYEENEVKHRAGLCHNCLAVVGVLLGRYAEGVAEFDEAATIFDDVGDPVNEASVRNNLGLLLTRLGDWEAAESNLEEAIRLARRMDITARLLHPLQNMAELQHARGAEDGGAAIWNELLELARETGYWDREIVALCALGTRRFEAGDLKGARKWLDAACELLPEDRAGWTEGRTVCHMLEARLAAAGDDPDRAVEVLEEAESALASRDRYEWATIRLAHGEILQDSDPDAARSIIEDAADTFRELGTKPMLERAEAALGPWK